MSLYTKYRPRDWDSVIGQDAISTILRASLESGRVGHAYIFTGSRGTGKTTSARILAKGVNCLDLQHGNPCHECANCLAFDDGNMLDVIEIDGASNNGVENVRDLIERARFEPNQGAYKIYIIDEVHMLSTGAFNALLKTLEEPPSHVKFILATTEIDKVPETIRSRALRFDFKKITESDIIKRLEFVVQAEGIQAEPEALSIIAKAARGGMRDALTLTEQNTTGGIISTEYVRSTLSLLENTLIEAVITAIAQRDQSQILSLLETLSSRHVEVRGFFDQILYALRDHLFRTLGTDEFFVYDAILSVFEDAYTRIRSIPDGWLLIEITLLRAVRHGESGPAPITPVTTTKTKPTPTKPETIPTPIAHEPAAPIIPPVPVDTLETPVDTSTEEKKAFSYVTLLNTLKSEKPALVADLKNARFEKENTTLTLIFSKKWNYDRINTPSNQSPIIDVLGQIFGGAWSLICKLDEGSYHSSGVDEVF